MKKKPKKQGRTGRPLKLTQPLLKHLVELITATGCTLGDAAAASGVHRATLQRWLATGNEQRKGIFRDLHDKVRAAEANGKIMDLGTVSKAAGAGVWQAAKWRLEVKHPKEFAPRVLVHVREEQQDAIRRLEEAFPNVDEKLSAGDALERALAAIAGEGRPDASSGEEDGEGDSTGSAVGAALAVRAPD